MKFQYIASPDVIVRVTKENTYVSVSAHAAIGNHESIDLALAQIKQDIEIAMGRASQRLDSAAQAQWNATEPLPEPSQGD